MAAACGGARRGSVAAAADGVCGGGVLGGGGGEGARTDGAVNDRATFLNWHFIRCTVGWVDRCKVEGRPPTRDLGCTEPSQLG